MTFKAETLQADFTSQDYYRNPAAAIEKLRALGPVVQVRFPILGTVWATTTQALADQVLKDTDTFTIREEDGTVAGTAMVDAAHRALARQQHAVDGRARSQTVARYRRRGVPPPRRARHGAAYSRYRRPARR